MKLFILFGQRAEEYAGQYAPEVLLCWDEFCIDENPDGWTEAVDKEKAKALDSKDFTSVRIITVDIDGNKISRLLNDTPNVVGTVGQ